MQDTQLQVKVPVALKPVFMISHAVTPDSPLNGKTQADILKERGFFILIVSVSHAPRPPSHGALSNPHKTGKQ